MTILSRCARSCRRTAIGPMANSAINLTECPVWFDLCFRVPTAR